MNINTFKRKFKKYITYLFIIILFLILCSIIFEDKTIALVVAAVAASTIIEELKNKSRT